MRNKQLIRIATACVALILSVVLLSWYHTKDLPPSVFFDQEYAQIDVPLSVSCKHYPSGTNFSYVWQIGDTVIDNHSATYTPTRNDLGKFITVTVTSDDDTPAQQLQMYFSELPVFYINTPYDDSVSSKDFYFDAVIRMQGNSLYNSSTTELYEGNFLIKGRGNSTWWTEKRSYRIKLEHDTDLMNMGSSKHWILHANPFDESLMRNKIAYDLSGAMGMPYMKSTWVDVIFNGTYVGNYSLCEQIRVAPNRVDITDLEKYASSIAKVLIDTSTVPADQREALENHLIWHMEWLTSGIVEYEGKTIDLSSFFVLPEINGGLLFELDAFYDEPSKFMVDNQPIQIRSPKYIGTNATVMQFAYEFVSAFYEASFLSQDFYTIYQGKATHYSELFDVDSLALYFLLTEIFFNEDAGLKSTYFYKDMDDLAHMGPIWDMDYSSGGVGHNAHVYDQWQVNFYSNYSQAKQWYKGLVHDPYFLSKVLECWETHRDSVMHLIDENNPLKDAYQYLYTSALANFAIWTNDSSQPPDAPINQRFQNGYRTLTQWLNNRIHWLDQQFTTLENLVDSIGAYDPGYDVSLTYSQGNATVTSSQGTTARFYFNGRIQAELPIIEGQASWAVPAELMTSASDVIQVRVYNDDELWIGSDYQDFR